MQKRIFTSLMLMATVLAAIVSCGGDPELTTPALPAETAAPTRRPVIIPTVPPGWRAYSRSAYQIALPGSWQEVKLTENELKNAIASAQENNPPFAEQLRTLLESGQYSSFLFYGTEIGGGVVNRNVSVAHVALEGTNDLDAFANSYAQALPNVMRGAKVVELQTPLRVNGIDAASIIYEVPIVNSAGALNTLRGAQFLFRLDSGDAYLVTVTGDANESDTLTPLARQIAASFVAVTP